MFKYLDKECASVAKIFLMAGGMYWLMFAAGKILNSFVFALFSRLWVVFQGVTGFKDYLQLRGLKSSVINVVSLLV